MAVYKEEKTGTWRVIYRYTDWTGEKKQTQKEYLKFAEVMMDKPQFYYAFEMLYWCGVREGELLALTPADFDFKKGTVSINKSYQRLNGQDVITTPKTEKSNPFSVRMENL